MKRLSPDSWLAIGLFVILAIITVAAALQQTQEQATPPLSSFSSNPNGALALKMWLDKIGCRVEEETLTNFQIPEDVTLVFILEPIFPIIETEWETIDTWVRGGGTLILAGDERITDLAVAHYEFDLIYVGSTTSTLALQSPLFTAPPLQDTITHTVAHFRPNRNDFVTHVALGALPVITSFPEGEGRVILSATARPFTNIGLKKTGNSTMVLNLITAAQSPKVVWFDEWHHGLRANEVEVTGPWDWLRRTPAGRGLLFISLALFITLVLRGQQFGRPVPLPSETARRGPLEYITAMANLNRRAGHRTAVLQQYRHWLKRDLSQRYRLDPTLPDDEYVTQLQKFNSGLDYAALRALLKRLHQTNISETDMVTLVAEVTAWLNNR